MKWAAVLVTGIVISVFGIYAVIQRNRAVISPIIGIIDRPLDRYSIPNLQHTVFPPSQLVLDEATATSAAYTTYSFHYLSEGKKVTGVAHIPTGPKPADGYPVIVQFRGYVDAAKYYPGEGTEHSAEVFAANGFLSLAPDFLGYGGSDKPSTDVFEERFQTYTTALTLLSSVGTLTLVDPSRVGVWGHSNGGHIALTVLEAASRAYPVSLWAPVTKSFPYSILYYTDEAEDHGKALRKELAAFERLYDADLYSLTNYLPALSKHTVQIHQGTADDAVPVAWTDEFVRLLKENDVTSAYYTYQGSDHNLSLDWNTVISRDIAFFTRTLRASGK